MTILYWGAALVGHGALWVEVVNRLHGLGWPRRVIDAVTLGCGAAVSGVPLVAAWTLRNASPPGSAPAWLEAYAWFCLAVLVTIALTRAALRWDPHLDRRVRLTSRRVADLHASLGDAATGSATVRSLAKLPGNRLLQVAVEERLLLLDRLPTALDGLRVAHLTDLHMSGRLAIDYFQEIVRVVNDWRPDLVCVTGDIVEHTPQLEWIGPTLGQLESSLGAFFVLGNHDDKLDADELRRRLTGSGLVDVGRQTVRVTHNGESLTLCGDERPWFPSAPALDGDEPLVVCLAHTPDRFGWAVQNGIDLVLAGHCHGGQVCLPVIGPLLCPSRHGVRYAAGAFRRGATAMHVGRGTGSLFPLRYNCPPEVTLLTLATG